MSPRARWAVTAVFATAFGYLEAAVVLYLRTMVNRIDPYQPNPLPATAALAFPELGRELATMIMLGTLGWLAGRTWRGRIGFALLAFGIWDITYYIFLIPLTGWPNSLSDWDILFLIPLPWWGPVWSPVSIAGLMILFGIFVTVLEQGEPPIWPRKLSLVLCALGITLALYVFMADAIAALPGGEAALRATLPKSFKTGIFGLAWILMAVPVAEVATQLFRRYR
jgi:hypothetical protein